MTDSFADIDRIRLAIGDLCIAWAHLEDGYYTLVIYQFAGWDLEVSDALRNAMDIRQMAQFQKSVALSRPSKPSSTYLAKLASRIDADLRPPRNRYVHDPIYAWGSHYARHEHKTRIWKPQSRQIVVEFSKHYPIYEGEIEQLTHCVRIAEDYVGALISILEGEESNIVGLDYSPLDQASARLDAAIASYIDLTKSDVSK